MEAKEHKGWLAGLGAGDYVVVRNHGIGSDLEPYSVGKVAKVTPKRTQYVVDFGGSRGSLPITFNADGYYKIKGSWSPGETLMPLTPEIAAEVNLGRKRLKVKHAVAELKVLELDTQQLDTLLTALAAVKPAG